MSLNTHAVRGLVDELDLLVPRAGASVAINKQQPDVCELLANRSGYLRLGIELMKAGLAETPAPQGDVHAIDADFGDLFDSRSLLVLLLRTSDDSANEEIQAAFQKNFRVAFMLLLGLFAILAAIGMVGVAIWFTS